MKKKEKHKITEAKTEVKKPEIVNKSKSPITPGKNRRRTVRELQAAFLSYFAQLPLQSLAAGFIGVHENTITAWKKKYPSFRDSIATAKSQWALDQTKSVKSKEWLLERVMNDHFKEPMQDGGDVPGSITVTFKRKDGNTNKLGTTAEATKVP